MVYYQLTCQSFNMNLRWVVCHHRSPWVTSNGGFGGRIATAANSQKESNLLKTLVHNRSAQDPKRPSSSATFPASQRDCPKTDPLATARRTPPNQAAQSTGRSPATVRPLGRSWACSLAFRRGRVPVGSSAWWSAWWILRTQKPDW